MGRNPAPMTQICELGKDAVIHRILFTESHVGDFWMIHAHKVLNQHFYRQGCWKHKYFLWKAKLGRTLVWSHWCCFYSAASFRDADGDVDTCPMWTFPTVRPTSINKLQKGYTHPDSEVRRWSGQLHTGTYYYFFALKPLFLVCSQEIQWKDNPSLNLCLLWSRPFSER